MIELKEGVYYVASWFMPIRLPSGGTGDMLGILYKEGDKHDASIPWKMQYRFRWHKDDKAFDSKDEKSWYSASIDGSMPEDKVEELAKGVEQYAKEFGGAAGEFTWSRIRGDYMAAMVAITGEDHAHVKTGREADEYAKKHGLDT